MTLSMARKPIEHRSPVEIAFATSQRLASTSGAVRLTHAPLDVTQIDVLEGLEGTRAALLRAYRTSGATQDHLEHWAREQAGYLYGLAVGVALGSRPFAGIGATTSRAEPRRAKGGRR
jgi:hypothetical protein